MDIKKIFGRLINYDICTVEEFNLKIDKMKAKTDEMFDYLKKNIDENKNGYVNTKEGLRVVKYYWGILKAIIKGYM